MPLFNTVTTKGMDLQNTSDSFSHAASGTDRIAIVTLHARPLAEPTLTVTYGGVSMTLLVSIFNGFDARVYFFYLINPATGSQTVAVTESANSRVRLVTACRTYTDVHQSSPFGTNVTNTGNNTTPTVTVNSTPDQLVVDAATVNARNSSGTVGSGQTQRVNENFPSTGPQDQGVLAIASEEVGAASVVMDWTTTSNPWATIGVPLKPPVFTGTFVPWIGTSLE